jgi:phosphoglycerate dehydrogenase-like enzyme
MRIKLNKSDWRQVGYKMGWLKQALNKEVLGANKPKVLLITRPDMWDLTEKDLIPLRTLAEVDLVRVESMTEEQLAKKCDGYDHLMLNMDFLPFPDLNKMDKLTSKFYNHPKITSLKSINVDMTDADFFSPILAKQKGILIQTCPNVVTRNVAESTICEITLHAKQRHLSYVADQNCLKTMQLHGKTAGIIGNGNIGKAVGKVLSAMGMTVLYNDITESKAATSIERIFKESAVISIHIPAIQKGLNKSNIGFIDSKLLDLCKEAILINLSTDIIVDSASLISALNSEKIIGYSVESGRKVTDKLKKYKQVHIAPCSFDSDEARKTVRSRWIQNTVSIIKGTPENIWAELKQD